MYIVKQTVNRGTSFSLIPLKPPAQGKVENGSRLKLLSLNFKIKCYFSFEFVLIDVTHTLCHLVTCWIPNILFESTVVAF